MNYLAHLSNEATGMFFNRNRSTFIALIAVATSAFSSVASADGEDELNNVLNYRSAFFSDEPQFGPPRSTITSLSLETELFLDLTERLRFTTKPHVLYEHDSVDDNHLDLREFLFTYSGDVWEARFGIAREFWGVTESRHLVDTINQSDFAADFTGDTKLGQPMISATWFSDYGDLSAYYLPVFREPRFGSADTRPRFPFTIDENLTSYESSDEKNRGEFALRWSGNYGIWDVGLSYFNGNKRQPVITPTEQGVETRFRIIDQIGIDLQATSGGLLTKIEYIAQAGDEVEAHSEVVAGFEYTLSQIADTDVDLGLLTELLYDSREEGVDHSFERDVMVGIRLAFNDESSTEALATTIVDVETRSKLLQVEFNRRIGRNFNIGLSGNWWRNTEEDAGIDIFRSESYMQLDLDWYF